MQVHYLDECFVILLLYRHEHADNITKQVGSALWHTVEEYGLIQPDLVELSIQLVKSKGVNILRAQAASDAMD